MGKFSTSMDLLKRAATVVSENKKLLLFPLIVSACIIVMAAFYLAPIALASTGHALTDPAHWKAIANHWFDVQSTAGGGSSGSLKPTGYLLFAGFYLLAMFIATFFNVAFFHEILRALDGRPVSIRSGVRFAVSRLKSIAIWSLFAGLVGLLIRALEERIGVFGRWVTAVIGLAWSVASVFAIPAIIRDEQGVNPLRYLKFSASILRRTWGETIIGYAGITLGRIALAIGMGCFVILIIFPVLIVFRSPAIVLAVGVTGIGCIILVSYILGVVNQVYRGALFIYATEGVVPGPFNESDMNMAWKVKTARKAR